MTEEKEANQSSNDISKPVNNDPVSMKMEMIGEKLTEDTENVEEKEEGVEEDQEDVDKEEELKEEGEEVEEVVEEEGEETESEEDTEDEQENKLEPEPVDVSIDGEKVLRVEVSLQKNPNGTEDSPINGIETNKSMHGKEVTSSLHVGEALVGNNVGTNQKPAFDDVNGSLRPDAKEGHNAKVNAYDSLKDKRYGDETMSSNQSSSKAEHMKEELKNEAKIKEGTMCADGRNPSDSSRFDSDTSGGGESGTEEEQSAFVMELYKFHKERSLDFRPPKFYGEPLNLLKLWRAVLKLGGYDKVTACKYWRQVGESFNPPKTCTTISWTFRVFYEKALLDYERYRGIDSSTIPCSFAVAGGVENQAAASGRARRESAARAMQGWHSQRILDNGEVSDPIIKDKNSLLSTKKEKQLKNLGIPKRKKLSSTDLAIKPVQTKFPKTQTETTVIDIGSPADWVKINVRVTKDCYEVYALVPGLLREEVRVQSDPAGRLVISGEPENPDNPWSVTPFKKVVSLPSRIDPHQTSAVVTLHGQLFVRVPFEQYD